MKNYGAILELCLVTVALTAIGCSKVGFNTNDGASTVGAAGRPSGDNVDPATGQVTQGGIPNGSTPVPPGTQLPPGGSLPPGTVVPVGTVVPPGGDPVPPGGVVPPGGWRPPGGVVPPGTVIPPGTVLPPGSTLPPGILLPRGTFYGPECHYNSNCSIFFRLANPMAYPFTFHWHTNDAHLGMTQPPSPAFLGIAGLDYVTKEADVTFPIAAVEEQDFVHDINMDPSRSLVIGVIWTDCSYGGVLFSSCKPLFP